MLLTKLWSEPLTFEPVTFEPGLNILLAHILEHARNGGPRSRNGAGKTTFAEVIRFCLLAPLQRDSVLRDQDFSHCTFSIEFQHGGRKYVISRSLQNPSAARVYIDESLHLAGSVAEIRQSVLYWLFGLEPDSALQFQQLLGFLIRDEVNGYSSPFKPFEYMGQPIWAAANLFFMGLDHRLPFLIADLQKERDEVATLRKGLISHLESKGMAEPILVRMELQSAREELQAREKQLESFRVNEEYQTQLGEANLIQKRVRELRTANFADSQRLNEYRDLLRRSAVSDSDVNDAVEIYRQLQFQVPDILRRTLEDVVGFHSEVLRTRSNFLQQEMAVLELTIGQRNEIIDNLDRQRSLIMAALKASGQLEEFYRLGQALTSTRERAAQLEMLDSIHSDIEKRGHQLADLDAKARHAADICQNSLYEHRSALQDVSERFAIMYKRLWGHAASVSVEFKGDAFEFGVKGIGRELKSSGRFRSAIFCYDLAVLHHNQSRLPFPHWVLHDGLFTGVDSEQVGTALRIASELPSDLQYICTINSDQIPPDMDFTAYVRREISDTPPEKRFMGKSF